MTEQNNKNFKIKNKNYIYGLDLDNANYDEEEIEYYMDFPPSMNMLLRDED